MTRSLKDIISDVDRLYGSKWGLSIEEAHELTSHIQRLEDKIRGLENQKFNNEQEVDKLKELLNKCEPLLKTYASTDTVYFQELEDLLGEIKEMSK